MVPTGSARTSRSAWGWSESRRSALPARSNPPCNDKARQPSDDTDDHRKDHLVRVGVGPGAADLVVGARRGLELRRALRHGGQSGSPDWSVGIWVGALSLILVILGLAVRSRRQRN